MKLYDDKGGWSALPEVADGQAANNKRRCWTWMMFGDGPEPRQR